MDHAGSTLENLMRMLRKIVGGAISLAGAAVLVARHL